MKFVFVPKDYLLTDKDYHNFAKALNVPYSKFNDTQTWPRTFSTILDAFVYYDINMQDYVTWNYLYETETVEEYLAIKRNTYELIDVISILEFQCSSNKVKP